MLGIREPDLYGKKTYSDLVEYIKEYSRLKGITVECVQSNCEGKIVGFIQNALGNFDGIVINAGAYTHTSIAILDALKAVGLPTVEVHITDISAREEFRKFSYISLYAEKLIKGEGFDGYLHALDYLTEKYN